MSVKIRDKKVSNNSSSAWERVTAGTVITEEKNIIGKLSPPKRQQPIRSHGEGTFPRTLCLYTTPFLFLVSYRQ